MPRSKGAKSQNERIAWAGRDLDSLVQPLAQSSSTAGLSSRWLFLFPYSRPEPVLYFWKPTLAGCCWVLSKPSFLLAETAPVLQPLLVEQGFQSLHLSGHLWTYSNMGIWQALGREDSPWPSPRAAPWPCWPQPAPLQGSAFPGQGLASSLLNFTGSCQALPPPVQVSLDCSLALKYGYCLPLGVSCKFDILALCPLLWVTGRNVKQYKFQDRPCDTPLVTHQHMNTFSLFSLLLLVWESKLFLWPLMSLARFQLCWALVFLTPSWHA